MSWTSGSHSDCDLSYQIMEIGAHKMHADKNEEWPATDNDPPTEMNKDFIETDTEIEKEAENEVNADNNEGLRQ